jgi:hypothetical protein
VPTYPDDIRMFASTLVSKGRAVCGSSARTDPCGGGQRWPSLPRQMNEMEPAVAVSSNTARLCAPLPGSLRAKARTGRGENFDRAVLLSPMNREPG